MCFQNGPQCLCCSPMDAAVLRRRATTRDGFFCEDLSASIASNTDTELPTLSGLSFTSEMQWSPVKALTTPLPVPRMEQRPLRLQTAPQARLGHIVGHLSSVGASAAFRRRAGREKWSQQSLQGLQSLQIQWNRRRTRCTSTMH